MTCGNCGNDRAFRFFMGRGFECCDRCAHLSVSGVPDVYWDGGPEHGLADDPRTGQPRVFASKREKAAYLKAHGLQEAGDRIRGANPSILRQAGPRENPRDDAMKALSHVRQMGADVRRQEMNRILRESRR